MRLMGHLVAVAKQGDSLWSVTKEGWACLFEKRHYDTVGAGVLISTRLLFALDQGMAFGRLTTQNRFSWDPRLPLCRPSGALPHLLAYPGLTPGATFLTRQPHPSTPTPGVPGTPVPALSLVVPAFSTT